MAALAYGVCAVIRELCTLSDAFVRCGYNVKKSLNFLREKNRLRLFQKYCETFWLQYEYESHGSELVLDSNLNSKNRSANKDKMRRGQMPRGIEVDFAAVEAAAMAMEAADGYPINEDFDEIDSDKENAGNEKSFEFLEDYDDIEVITGVEMDAFNDYVDAHPQCYEQNLGELEEGVSFIITGRILLTCERFAINFIVDNPTSDIALHINPRLPQNFIVRNTRVRGVWGKEEVASQLMFNLNRGTNFSIQVLITKAAFMISANGYHFADYKHRVPFQTIKALEVKGDVENVLVERKIVTSYPDRKPASTRQIRYSLLTVPFRDNDDGTVPEQAFYDTMSTSVIMPKRWRAVVDKRTSMNEKILPMPYIGRLQRGSFMNGCALRILGRVKLLPHSFYINLQDGQNIWPHQNVAFHFNPRFPTRGGQKLGKAVVCRNAWYDGQWGKEERSELDTNLRPGKQFVLMIRCTKTSFIVYVDRKYVTTFNHQIDASTITTVYIRGDIRLFDVSLMSPNVDPSEVNIIENPLRPTDDFEQFDDTEIGAEIKEKELFKDL